MISVPTVDKLNFKGKNVLVRGDFDVENGNNPRADSIRDIVYYLKSNNAGKIKVIGHTETDYDLASLLRTEFPDVEFDSDLRKNPGEKANDIEFAKQLADGWDIYINEAFATSHREHASIVALPQQFKSKSKDSVAMGLRFKKEIENLDRVLENPRRPVVAVISGIKTDKMERIAGILHIVDKVLVGGLLPKYYADKNPDPDKIILADLLPDTQDITIHSVEKFKNEIAKAGTIILAGVPGKYEDEGHRQGTMEVFNAIANSSAYKVAGGGDAEAAIALLGLSGNFDLISVGGGAMLEYLTKGTLPGIQALLD